MDNIKTYNDFLLESKQTGILYHFTNIENLFKILESNILKARSRVFKRNKTFNKKFYTKLGISLTRNKRIEPMHVKTECAIVLDGDKLSHNYKIFPYDDFSDLSKSNINKSINKLEFEERLIGNVNNIEKYIKYIILFDNIDFESIYYLNFNVSNKLNRKTIEGKDKKQILHLISNEIRKYNIPVIIEKKEPLIKGIKCTECNDKPTICYNCEGTGFFPKNVICPNCEGTGNVSCEECGNTYYN